EGRFVVVVAEALDELFVRRARVQGDRVLSASVAGELPSGLPLPCLHHVGYDVALPGSRGPLQNCVLETTQHPYCLERKIHQFHLSVEKTLCTAMKPSGDL